MKSFIAFVFMLTTLMGSIAQAQGLYFPPLSGSTWDTLSPATLNWCQPRIDSLYQYLDNKHTKAFIILKDGKIVLEKYFGNYTADSIHYWASAGKSLTAMLTGIAQEKGFLNIQNTASQYLGQGWTSAPLQKENLITLQHLLSMTSGLNDNPPAPCDNEDSSKTCLTYLADAGTRWAYHTGAYKHLQKAISNASGITYNAFTNLHLGSHIGLSGLWYNGVFYSNTRGMARYGLLTLNKGIWNTDTVLHDISYWNDMTNTSQNYNHSYGYLWWLNGKSSFMLPGVQIVFPGSMLPDAPSDMFAALGKNDQKIYVVPSQNMVVVRTGDAAYSTQLAITVFDNELWQKIDSLDDCPTSVLNVDNEKDLTLVPNPVNEVLYIHSKKPIRSYKLYDPSGSVCLQNDCNDYHLQLHLNKLATGIYYLKLESEKTIYRKIIKL
jgi:CubicO group peptidase (beta-lactamase class C family)